MLVIYLGGTWCIVEKDEAFRFTALPRQPLIYKGHLDRAYSPMHMFSRGPLAPFADPPPRSQRSGLLISCCATYITKSYAAAYVWSRRLGGTWLRHCLPTRLLPFQEGFAWGRRPWSRTAYPYIYIIIFQMGWSTIRTLASLPILLYRRHQYY